MIDLRLIGEQNWRRLPSSRFGMMNVFDDAVSELDSFIPSRLPSLRGCSDLLLASDYGGQHSGSQYQTYSFLLVSGDDIGAWLDRRAQWRAQWLPDGRRLSYKSLSDALRAKALAPFLDVAHLLRGALITFAINTDFKSLLTRTGHILYTSTKLSTYQHWRPKPFERLYRICHFAGFLLAGLSFPDQTLHWITDEDEVVASPRHQEDLRRLFSDSLRHYLPHTLGDVRISTTRSDTGRRDVEDLVTLPDLAAGAVLTFLQSAPESRRVSPLVLPIPDDTASKAKIIYSWLSIIDQPLKKLVLAIDPQPGTHEYQVRWIQFVPLDPIAT